MNDMLKLLDGKEMVVDAIDTLQKGDIVITVTDYLRRVIIESSNAFNIASFDDKIITEFFINNKSLEYPEYIILVYLGDSLFEEYFTREIIKYRNGDLSYSTSEDNTCVDQIAKFNDEGTWQSFIDAIKDAETYPVCINKWYDIPGITIDGLTAYPNNIRDNSVYEAIINYIMSASRDYRDLSIIRDKLNNQSNEIYTGLKKIRSRDEKDAYKLNLIYNFANRINKNIKSEE